MSFLGTALGGLLQSRDPRKVGGAAFGAPDTFGVSKMGTATPYPADDILGKLGDIGDLGSFGPSKIGAPQLDPAFALPSLALNVQTLPSGSGALPPGTGPGGGTVGGGLGNFGGEFAVLNQYDTQFRTAAAKFGLPANALKAIAAIERGWEGSGVSPSGAVGIMQVMPQYWGDKGYDIWSTDGNIMAGALAYKTFYDQYHDEAIQRGMDPYVAAARAYLAGDPWSGASDDFGTTTDIYGTRFQDYLSQLGGLGSSSGGTGTSGGTASIDTLFGGAQVQGWGEFNVPSDLPYYSYGNQYGLNGSNHTGLDVPMTPGTPYRAPMGGVVTCSGTGDGPGTDGGGCAAFECKGYCSGGSAGRVEVLLDNGAILIYGHSSTSALRPGARFSAGAVLGTSGGENSGHVHLEARVRDSSTSSGWRIVDPRTVLGGATISGTSSSGQYTPGASPPILSQPQRLRQFATGSY